MINEIDLSQERKWYYEIRAKTVIKNLQKRKMNGQYVPDRKEALAAIMEMIPPGAIVARGDSVSVDQVGIVEEIKKRGKNRFIDPLERDANDKLLFDINERHRLVRESFSADIYICSTNAITLDGKLVSIDRNGNRVSAMIYGPDKVIFVVGANKITKDVEEALTRVHNLVAPINNIRHFLKHKFSSVGDLPCNKAGFCVDCSHPQRACNYTVIIEGSDDTMRSGRINVMLVGEDLGI
jgi:hypothetical protein